MTHDEAALVLEEAEELMDRLPPDVGACFFLFDRTTGVSYLSNLERAAVITMIKQFIARNTQ